jgi:hypothetical protein
MSCFQFKVSLQFWPGLAGFSSLRNRLNNPQWPGACELTMGRFLQRAGSVKNGGKFAEVSV